MCRRQTAAKTVILQFVIIVTFFAYPSVPSTAQEIVGLQTIFSITGNDMLKPINMPGDVFVDDANGEIYVLDAGNRRVIVFEMDGFRKYKFNVPGESGTATGLAVDHRGEILLAVDGKVAVCSFRGNLLEYVDFHDFPYAEEVRATRLDVDKENNYYVLDAGKKRILTFDKDWNFRFAIDENSFPKTIRKASHGKKQETSMVESLSISDLCVDDEGSVYFIDPMRSYVYIFSNEGTYVRSMGEPGSTFTTLSLPFGVAVDSQGRVLVTDSTGHGLLVYGKDGKFLFAFGGLGRGEGRLYFPKYVATDGSDRVYVVEPFLGRVQVLDAEQRPETTLPLGPETDS